MRIDLVILGQPVSWKNSKQISCIAGRIVSRKSDIATAWQRSAIKQLMIQRCNLGLAMIPKTTSLNAKIVSYCGNHRIIDASNLYQGPEDVLQAAGILEDDSCIESHDGSRREYDKKNPRVEITLTEVRR